MLKTLMNVGLGLVMSPKVAMAELGLMTKVTMLIGSSLIWQIQA